jgi:hypothetical protein
MHIFRLFELLYARSNTTIFLLESAVVSATVVSFCGKQRMLPPAPARSSMRRDVGLHGDCHLRLDPEGLLIVQHGGLLTEAAAHSRRLNQRQCFFLFILRSVFLSLVIDYSVKFPPTTSQSLAA